MKRIFNKLFNIRDEKTVERPKAFSQPSKLAEVKTNAPKVVVQPLEFTSEEAVKPDMEVDVTAMFYSLLFPSRTSDNGGAANKLEQQVMKQVEHALSSPQTIADNVLKLPTRALELDGKLANESFETKDILSLIQQDPVLSAEVLKLCNSPAFKRNDKEITNLQQAVVQLGRQQLRRLITSCVVKDMIDIKPIYFRRFGAEIWRHSMQVAFLASELSGDDQDTAFMMGLLHDVGKIAIFKILVDAFVNADVSEQPCSSLFRQVMTSRSLTLSALLVKCWQLPSSFEDELLALGSAHAAPEQSMANTIWRANIISECSMLRKTNKLSDQQLAGQLIKVEVELDTFDTLHEKLMLF